MKKLSEEVVRKDTTIIKTQFDREWFYSVKDMEDYLNEDLAAVEAINLPIVIEGQEYIIKCATWDDITRALQKEPLENFKGSVLRSPKPNRNN